MWVCVFYFIFFRPVTQSTVKYPIISTILFLIVEREERMTIERRSRVIGAETRSRVIKIEEEERRKMDGTLMC